MPRWENQTPEQIAEATTEGRRASRFKAAEDRIKRIVDGMPPLTDEQLAKLAVLLQGAGE